MSTVKKAMELLGFFSVEKPEIGLTELRKLANRDKATTYRHLLALESAGLLEKNPATKAYRIGPAVLRLAHLRETTMPRRVSVVAELRDLAELTGETAHVSILESVRLHPLEDRESTRHSTRVVLDAPELPLHATASGVAVLAYGGPELRQAALDSMTKYTESTPTDAETLNACIAEARASGFSESREGFEVGVHGIAVPLFDHAGSVAGAVAVATLAARMAPELHATILGALAKASRQITTNWGGTIPAQLENAWTQTLANMTITEPTA
ncbi:MAG TPA: IclR family transcriptional regulator [Paracoccaceae bacterium]|nr:IclR family transcriptional regulator [Paracoccaceae bacterium]